jgi:hypothetical protein
MYTNLIEMFDVVSEVVAHVTDHCVAVLYRPVARHLDGQIAVEVVAHPTKPHVGHVEHAIDEHGTAPIAQWRQRYCATQRPTQDAYAFEKLAGRLPPWERSRSLTERNWPKDTSFWSLPYTHPHLARAVRISVAEPISAALAAADSDASTVEW